MNSKDKARLEELEDEECLVDAEDIIDYFRLSCEKLEEENDKLKKENQELEKENQELIEALKTPMNDQIYYRYEELKKENRELIRKADCCMWLECNKISEENEKLKSAIQQAIELLSVDGKGTKQEVKKLLSEVLDNGNMD